MDDEREKGRINGWLTRLDKALVFAEQMVPVLEQAHYEAPATLRGYADWLNARDYKTEAGKVWRAETVSRIFAIDQRAREIAEKAFARELARRSYLKLDTTGVEDRKRGYVNRAAELGEQLRGPWEAVVDRTKDFPK